MSLKNKILSHLPVIVKRQLYNFKIKKRFVPPIGNVSLGDFKRTEPFSKEFGFDRGGPVDRYYIENFFQQESGSIVGRVMEIGDNSYTLQYGGDKVSISDILHVDDSNANATIIADLSDAPHLPDNAFDCILLAQTLHLIYDFKSALRTCYRILKPGGTLLMTVPGITPIDYEDWGSTWFWSFTDMAMKRVMAETFPGASIEVCNFGNVLSASAFLYGMGANELSKEQLDVHDPNMQVVVTVKAIKIQPHATTKA